MERMRGQQVSETKSGSAALLVQKLRRVIRDRFANLANARGERRMELVETLPLGGKRQLLLILCDGRRFLVGVGGDSVFSIAELNESAAFSVADS